MNTPFMNELLLSFAKSMEEAPHGQKGGILANACEQLKLSKATVHRKIKEVMLTKRRKRRSDAGTTSLSLDDAKMISAFLLEHMRKNGKQIVSLDNAVDCLRANNMIKAIRVDSSSGEVFQLSNSAILRALSGYKLHPDQLLAPAPVTRLRSEHPNHVWQIDASRCILYYLPQAPGDNGLRIANHNEFYKNKPANLIKAIKESLWRYVVTDHTSGSIYASYVTGGETGENLANFFIKAMTKRPNQVMHGVPTMVMLDPGSANTGAIFKNLCQSLRVHVQINEPGNPRAKGSVEKAQDIVERQFESKLRLLANNEVSSIENINSLCDRWLTFFNGSKIHSRHRQTRDVAWLNISVDELLIAPSVEQLKELAISAPESRVVSPMLSISYKGHEYDVSNIPNVFVGEKIMVCFNPWRIDSIQAIGVNDEGIEIYHILERIQFDKYGQALDAATIGKSFKRHLDTPAQENLKALELLATDTSTVEEAKQARKQKAVPFGGKVDPFKNIDKLVIPAAISKKGTLHDLASMSVKFPPLNLIEASKQIKPLLENVGISWTAVHFNWLGKRFPEGVPPEMITTIVSELLETHNAPLRLVK